MSRRLNICSGTAVRFEPSETKTVNLIPIGGSKFISGGNNLVLNYETNVGASLASCLPTTSTSGSVTVGKGIPVDIGNPPPDFVDKLLSMGFRHKDQSTVPVAKPVEMSRETYAQTFGPTKGDRIRLGDTCLVVEIEKDLCAGDSGENYGDEVKFGGGE